MNSTEITSSSDVHSAYNLVAYYCRIVIDSLTITARQ